MHAGIVIGWWTSASKLLWCQGKCQAWAQVVGRESACVCVTAGPAKKGF